MMTVSPQNTDMTTISQGVEYRGSGSLPLIGSPKYCPWVNRSGGYLCETGHCCGETGCCTYYYELWWFWLLWTVLIMFSCCCAYRHRRAKLRIQQQQRQREINLIAYHGACNYPTSMLDLSFLASFKLPSYEEVAAQPSTPPPPYSSVFALQGGRLYAQAGPSGMTSSPSSDNYTSCSCESCSGTSPCSTSFSVQVTYETDTSNATTPSEGGDFQPLSPAPSLASPAPPLTGPAPPLTGPALLQTPLPAPPSPPPAPPPPPVAPAIPLADAALTDDGSPPGERPEEGPASKPTLSPPKHALFSSNVDFFEPDCRTPCASDGEEEDVDADESQYRHRRLTGDSGIEVCRCQVESEEEEEEEREGAEPSRETGKPKEAEGEADHPLHDSVDCSNRAQNRLGEDCASLCSPGPALLKEDAVITVESS